jgi:hypothetical protein
MRTDVMKIRTTLTALATSLTSLADAGVLSAHPAASLTAKTVGDQSG